MQLSDFPVTHVAKSRLAEVDFAQLGFGAVLSDHMFSMTYADGEWRDPEIIPYQALSIEPGVAMLHYGQTVFEGFKAFWGVDGRIRVFRPDMNLRRLGQSCARLCIPTPEPETFQALLLRATRELLELDQAWIPRAAGQSLYIRPLVIGTEVTLEVRAANSYRLLIMTAPVGAYFKDSQAGIALKVERHYTRAAPQGGLGSSKTAANYAASLLPAHRSQQEGFDQVLWLDGRDHRFVEEVGAMNIFFRIGEKVVTPPLGPSILPGVVRDSVLTLLADWGVPVEERPISIDEVADGLRGGTLEEIFGAGTAAVICPVARIGYRGESLAVPDPVPGSLTGRLYDEITGIQYGRLPDKHGWNLIIQPGEATGKARSSAG